MTGTSEDWGKRVKMVRRSEEEKEEEEEEERMKTKRKIKRRGGGRVVPERERTSEWRDQVDSCDSSTAESICSALLSFRFPLSTLRCPLPSFRLPSSTFHLLPPASRFLLGDGLQQTTFPILTIDSYLQQF
jgi:hypothetical protein